MPVGVRFIPNGLSCERFPVALNFDAESLFLSQRCSSTRVIETDAEQDRLEEMESGGARCVQRTVSKDFMLLTHAKETLQHLGITKYLNLGAWQLR